MNHPTDRRSIVTNLACGILTMCIVGSPSSASGQNGPPVSEPDVQASEGVPAQQKVEGRHWDSDTLVVASPWTARPVPAQDVEDLDVWTRLTWTIQLVVAPGTLAHVRPLYAYDPENLKGWTVHPDRIRPVATVKPCNQAEFLRAWAPASPDRRNDVFWCAYYTNDTIDAFRHADHLMSGTPDGDGPSDAYFATTYPLPGIEPEKRFVVEQPE